MKVHWFWNEWYDHCWLLIFAVYCMLMQKQQCTLAAVVDSEIFKLNNRNRIDINSIDRHAWPPMKNHDIWSDDSTYGNNENLSDKEFKIKKEIIKTIDQDDYEYDGSNFDSFVDRKKLLESFEFWNNNTTIQEEDETRRRSKVLHIFPVPVDGECLSEDGRRTGTCFNAYECRQKGGLAKGDCAMGFGVCCIFIANCNETIVNNITYMVSPQFPSFMPNNFSSCSIKIKLMSDDISQLRIDFNHFSLGQPNRRTGVCDGDVFNISGGPGGSILLCGQNSGQHLYYDVGGRSLPRQTLYGSLRPPTLMQIYPNLNTTTTAEQIITISMNFAQRFLPVRLWEVRIAQIPFSQRAPAGCLQYHLGTEGIIQTFNFADNGRHLANQNYKVCMRQEMEMCSIMYQPCDEQSFRIGPSRPLRTTMEQNAGLGGGAAGGGGVGSGTDGIGGAGGAGSLGSGLLMAAVTTASLSTTMSVMPAAVASQDATQQSSATMLTTNSVAPMRTTATVMSNTSTPAPNISMNASTIASTTLRTPSSTTGAVETTTTTTAAATSTMTTPTTTTTQTTSTTIATSPLSGDIFEGSGDDSSVTPGSLNVSRRPRPVGGGFDLLGFLRSAFELGLRRRRSTSRQPEILQRQNRQIFSTCSDRITLPCIIEDFIGTGLGPLPNCEPVHCGMQFCSSGIWPCRIESTVTPFFINIHFGNGVGKGSAEDNIGACLRYNQMQCM